MGKTTGITELQFNQSCLNISPAAQRKLSEIDCSSKAGHSEKPAQKNNMTAVLLVVFLFFFSFIQTQPLFANQKQDVAISGSTETYTALKIIYHTSEIDITPDDVLKGYIDLPSATQLEILNYNLAGYIVVFRALDMPFREISVMGLEQEVTVTSEGAVTTQSYHGRDPLTVKLAYRIILSDKAKPGKYKLSLNISVSPLIIV